MKNKKGFAAIDLILLVVILLIPMFMMITQEIRTDKNIAYANELAEEYIKKIEVEGPLTEQSRIAILKELEGKFGEINIEYTKQAVKPGEYVYLSINVKNKNMLGGVITNKTIIADGIAK